MSARVLNARVRDLLLDPYSRLSRILPDWARALLLGVSMRQLWEMDYRRFLGRLAEAPSNGIGPMQMNYSAYFKEEA